MSAKVLDRVTTMPANDAGERVFIVPTAWRTPCDRPGFLVYVDTSGGGKQLGGVVCRSCASKMARLYAAAADADLLMGEAA